jgi:hypothetical protein
MALLLACAACTPIGSPSALQDPGMASEAGQSGAHSCKTDGDCASATPCKTSRCERGVCSEQALAAGASLADDKQVKGDCQVLVCNEAGEVAAREDDSDDQSSSSSNPCQTVRCAGGQRVLSNADEATPCNGTGTCSQGTCSVCVDGQDCSGPEHCTVHIYRCSADGAECQDTGVPRANQSCGAGKVCAAGSCVPCMVGSACAVDEPCYSGRIRSCEPEMVCEPEPLTGTPCGSGEQGEARFCSAGHCIAACREGACTDNTDACMESHWDCSMSDEPMCVMATRDDGEACGDNAVCHAGACADNVLVNGDFSRGLEGWTVTGDGARFLVSRTNGPGGRTTLCTSPDGAGSGSAAVGTVSQRFTVPADALALRFVVTGGHAHVKLKAAGGDVLEDCVGRDSIDQRIPVSWDLAALRGQEVELAVEDEESTGTWGYVFTTGFDVIRDAPSALNNPLLMDGLNGWETTGDGQRFSVVESYNLYDGLNIMTDGVKMYGHRLIVSTYTTDESGQTTQAASRGTMAQSFTVPNDAVALRFDVFSGRTGCSVKLTENDQVLYEAAGVDSDGTHLPVSWALEPHRGKLLRLTVEDNSVSPSYGYIGVTGFDIITSFNGP